MNAFDKTYFWNILFCHFVKMSPMFTLKSGWQEYCFHHVVMDLKPCVVLVCELDISWKLNLSTMQFGGVTVKLKLWLSLVITPKESCYANHPFPPIWPAKKEKNGAIKFFLITSFWCYLRTCMITNFGILNMWSFSYVTVVSFNLRPFLWFLGCNSSKWLFKSSKRSLLKI